MTEMPLSVAISQMFTALTAGDSLYQAPVGSELRKQLDDLITKVEAVEMYAGDEFHTQEELYESRLFLNAHLFTLWSRLGIYPVVKSWRHHDGEPCFDGEYFIVVATLPDGQVSFHYKKEHWSKFQIPSVEFGPEWDGHTTKDAHTRLDQALTEVGIKVHESHTEWIKR